MKSVKMMIIFILFLALQGCGNGGFEGDYEALGGMQEFNFKSDGHMTQSMNGNKVAEFKFERSGNEIRVFVSDSAAQIFTLEDNGDLVGPGGLKLTAKE